MRNTATKPYIATISVVLAFAALPLGIAVAQQPAQATPATFTGCVHKAPDQPQTLVLSGQNLCAVLKGKLSADQLSGHRIELKGVLVPGTKSAAPLIQVDSVSSVGESCSDTCSLHPPASRGLHRPGGSVVPGSEGGTPGEQQH